MCPCCSLVCWALLVFSPPARRGSLDFNRGAGPSPSSPSPACLPPCVISASSGCCHAWTRTADRKLRWMWTVPGPDRHIASSGGCGVCLGPIAISRAQEAVEWAGPDHHIASAGSCVELDFWPTWFSIFDPKIRDCEAIEEPPNVVTSPCHASCPLTCRTSVPFCLD